MTTLYLLIYRKFSS